MSTTYGYLSITNVEQKRLGDIREIKKIGLGSKINEEKNQSTY